MGDEDNKNTEAEKKDIIDKENDDSEKKDPEKGDLEKLDTDEEATVNQWSNLSLQKRLGLLGCIIGLFLLVVIIILAACLVGGQQTLAFKTGRIVDTLTSCGKVQGIEEGENQYTFRSIPYSVQVDRFEHSRLPSTLDECGDEILEHTNETRTCLRIAENGEFEGEEDCLVLDISTPNLEYKSDLPVVVYLPGSSNIRPSSLLANEQQTVFVTVNIRQGILGFLSHPLLGKKQTPPISGNYGLNDVMTALKWIKLNVGHFGGNPEKITLLGHEDGASIATALTSVDESKDMIQRVWLTSGSGNIESLTLETAGAQWNEIVETHCAGKDRQCLLDVEAEQLVKDFSKLKKANAISNLPSKGKEKQFIMLVEDTHLITKPLQESLSEKGISVPIVLGSTSQSEANLDNFKFSTWNDTDETANIVESSLASFDLELPTKALEAYNSSSNWKDYISMVSDVRTICPLLNLAQTLRKTSSDVSFYVAQFMNENGELGEIADSDVDISAIFSSSADSSFPKEIQNFFYNFVKGHETRQNSGVSLFREEGETHLKDWNKCQIWRNNTADIIEEYARRY